MSYYDNYIITKQSETFYIAAHVKLKENLEKDIEFSKFRNRNLNIDDLFTLSLNKNEGNIFNHYLISNFKESFVNTILNLIKDYILNRESINCTIISFAFPYFNNLSKSFSSYETKNIETSISLIEVKKTEDLSENIDLKFEVEIKINNISYIDESGLKF